MYETQERAKRITDIHVLWGQSTVIEELIHAGKIDEEYIIDKLGCRWWGRLTSGQAIYMDGVIQEICGED